MDINVTVFEGDLKKAVNEELMREDRYTAETLSLRREDDGYIKSDTSDEVREIVHNVANEKGIAQVLHWNVITGQNDELDKLVNVKDEFKNGLIVSDFYKKTFFEYLFSKMDIDNQIKRDALYLPEYLSRSLSLRHHRKAQRRKSPRTRLSVLSEHQGFLHSRRRQRICLHPLWR